VGFIFFALAYFNAIFVKYLEILVKLGFADFIDLTSLFKIASCISEMQPDVWNSSAN